MNKNNKPRAAAKPPTTNAERQKKWRQKHNQEFKQLKVNVDPEIYIKLKLKWKQDNLTYVEWHRQIVKEYLKSGEKNE